MAVFKEFALKVGYKGAYPSTESNKQGAKIINEFIGTQFKGLMQIAKTTVSK